MNHRAELFLAVVVCACGMPAAMADTIGFAQTNLASDQPGVANFTDSKLVNPWGITAGPTSPFWLGVNGSGQSVIYNGAGVKAGLVVAIPGDGSVTGVAFANVPGSFNGDTFLFVSEDGTVSGWRGALGPTAERLQVGSSGNVLKGLDVGTVGGNTYAYIANFAAGTVDVLKGNAGAPDLTGKFTDPNLPSGYAPFNVRNIGGILYVTYAVQDGAKKDDVPGPGHGIVNTFDLNGNLIKRLITDGALNAPWGLALAPAGFGDVGGNLLVGNFGDGRIHAYNPSTGALVETLQNAVGDPLTVDGLWGLRFGNGANSGSTRSLYFTAGPDDESHGLFGQLVAVPEPGTWLLTTLLLPVLLRRRR